MKNIFVVVIILVSIVSCQQAEKYGYVDNGEIINNYQEKLDVEEKYKAKDEAFTKKTDSVSQAFQLEAQDFQLKSKRMSQKKAQELYDELGQKQQLLQQQLQFEQQQLQQAFNSEIDSVIVIVKNYIKDYGEANGYTYIFGTSDNSNSIMYGTAQNDLTQTILEGLNEAYKAKK